MRPGGAVGTDSKDERRMLLIMKTMRSQRGVTLIEVLVTVLIFSIGLLGLAGLQATSLRQNMSAYQRTQASVLAMDMLDRMRANRTAALAEQFDIKMNADPPSPANTMVEKELSNWLADLAATLPDGDGSIDCDKGTSVCEIRVRWNDRRTDESADTSFKEFVVSAQP